MSRPTSGGARRSRVLGAITLAEAMVLSIQACSSVPRRLAPPQVDLLGLSVLEAGPDGQLFSLRFVLVNPNPAEIPVVRLEFDIRLSGEGRLIGRYATPFTLPGRGSETLEVEVFSQIVSSASRLMAFATGPNNTLTYEFHGELVLDAGLREPIDVFGRGQVPFTIAIRGQ
jgi:LEA14-like dessication related protein